MVRAEGIIMNINETGPAARPIVVVSNRLPVDRVTNSDGSVSWKTSPGGLVTAMQPVVRELDCVWIGWPGNVGERLEPFEAEGISLRPVTLDEDDFEMYYEGFSNDTIWPLYHDVISHPGYHREWWDRYEDVNRRFAQACANAAEEEATVWVHDYQLQLVPKMLREMRPDLTIAFFMHIPFPAHGLFGQLPWRREVLEGLLGADVVGFQRVADAANFRSAVRRFVGAPSNGNRIMLQARGSHLARQVLAQEFPISIDYQAFSDLAASPNVQKRAQEIRKELGADRIILGVDRLDYTKGIHHRLKAFRELLDDRKMRPGEVTMVQVASPSRERVEAYQRLRDDIEITVSRINGDYGSMAHTPVVYFHRGFPREEMAALYVAADVLAVTSLRDGMNLVAKEYVACRGDERGVLVLSEFAGAADELRRAIQINPHDINGLKSAFLAALAMPEKEQQQRMRAMRKVVWHADVSHWAESFLRAVEAMEGSRKILEEQGSGTVSHQGPLFLPTGIDAALRRLANEPNLLVAVDFDGTIAPIVASPDDARVLPRAEEALSVLQESRGATVALISGRSSDNLAATGVAIAGRAISGSHGVELKMPGDDEPLANPLSDTEHSLLSEVGVELTALTQSVSGARLEQKPFGYAVHAREVSDPQNAKRLLEAAEALGHRDGVRGRKGKLVYELSVRGSNKGDALERIRRKLPKGPAVYIGDDLTDEDALATLGAGDLGVHVGRGKTAADFTVSDVWEATEVLVRLAQLRTGHIIGSSKQRSS
jgi:trehalose 6-phosphate synthase/phosphatase